MINEYYSFRYTYKQDDVDATQEPETRKKLILLRESYEFDEESKTYTVTAIGEGYNIFEDDQASSENVDNKDEYIMRDLEVRQVMDDMRAPESHVVVMVEK